MPTCRTQCRDVNNAGNFARGGLPLRTFIQETLRRSRTSYSTLQVALYYLILIKPHVPSHDFTMEQPKDMQSLRALQCGRRMFLSALILASKYLQDRNYSARAWSKISGLKVCEINSNELTFCQAVNWKFHIAESTFDKWTEIVLKCTPSSQLPLPNLRDTSSVYEWKHVIPSLTPELDRWERSRHSSIYGRDYVPATPRSTPSVACCPQSRDATPTPTKPPRFLEPRPTMDPPTPSLARMGPLPTPQMTPHTGAFNTPAASAAPFASRRPSMCLAMSQAQTVSMSRSALEPWTQLPACNVPDAFQFSSRRPSVAPSVSSSGSSPESMVSDRSSRSSRASSISSVSSSWASNQASLARMATCRNARLPCPPVKEKEGLRFSDLLCVEPSQHVMSSAAAIAAAAEEAQNQDAAVTALQSFAFSDPGCEIVMTTSPLPLRSKSFSVTVTGPTTPPTTSAPTTDSATDKPRSWHSVKGRKRGRSSADMSSLQQNVRNILRAGSPTLAAMRRSSGSSGISSTTATPTGPVASVPPTTATRFTPSAAGRGALDPDVRAALQSQSPSRIPAERRLPVQKELGRKRACCASEAAGEAVSVLGREGPGMWEGVL